MLHLCLNNRCNDPMKEIWPNAFGSKIQSNMGTRVYDTSCSLLSDDGGLHAYTKCSRRPSPMVGNKNSRIFSLLNETFCKFPIHSLESPTVADCRRPKSC
uniref:Uncharacterized protein n=1 Tax=Romanomermis culicivorax TaxID=13658 RepID=A0A915HXM4_ROMCU